MNAQTREPINVSAGWNLVGSLSTGSISTAISTIPSNIILSSFFRFNNGVYQAVTSIEAGESYWVRVSQDGKIYFNHPKLSSIDTVYVNEGWNSLGSLSSGSVSVIVSTSPIGLLASAFYNFDATIGALSRVNSLTRGSGYLINVNQNGKIIIQTTEYGQQNDDTSQVKLTFSEPMSRDGIFDVNNYLVLKDLVTPVQVYKVGIAQGDSIVVLFTEKYSETSTYKVIVNNLKDLAGNLINREFNFAFY
jgi:hypothetical protein